MEELVEAGMNVYVFVFILIECVIYVSFAFQLCPGFVFRHLLKKCGRRLRKQNKKHPY